MLLAKWLLIPSASMLLLYAAITIDRHYAGIAVLMYLAAALVAATQWVLARQTRCPLCLAPPVAHRRCSKHRSARRLLGSYRLRVALSVIKRKQFRCPYCGETTHVALRMPAGLAD